MSITFNDIAKANETIQTTDIKGKEYAEVNQRIKAFRMVFPTGRILTELLSNENGICVFRAAVTDDEGNTLGTGTAYEKESSSYINKTSYIENCETSAVGRALGMCGFGIDTSIASAEEVKNAIAGQEDIKDAPREAKKDGGSEPKKNWKNAFLQLCGEYGVDAAAYAEEHGIGKIVSDEQFRQFLTDIKYQPAGSKS